MERADATGGYDEQGDEAALAAGGPRRARKPQALRLTLEVIDAEVVQALAELPEGPAREAWALKALRLGVLAIRSAGGALDVQAMHLEGDRILAQVNHALTERGAKLTAELSQALTRYLDPATGALPQRLTALVAPGGELERALKAHLGGDDSTLARSLAASVGASSPLLKMLSPTESTGIKMQLEAAIRAALDQQREALLQQFSLDDENSALSRLVHSVEAAQSKITAEFTLDNEQSALARMSKLLKDTSAQIDKNLTLDDEQSALARLKRELSATLADMAKRNETFQAEVKTTLEVFSARKVEAAKGTQHGLAFEARLAELLAAEAQAVGDVHEAVGAVGGKLGRSRKGDVVTRLGADSAAPGAGVVWEAKQDAGCSLKGALAELDEARKNRECQLGVFVFSARTAPAGLAPFGRYGQDLVIVWDADDAASDLNVRAAYSVVRALAVRGAHAHKGKKAALDQLTASAHALARQAGLLAELKTWAETSKSSAERTIERAAKMQAELEKQVGAVNEAVASLSRDDAS